MEPFSEKPIDNLTSILFCTKLEANRGVSGGASHDTIQFNSSQSRNCRNHHGRETAEIVCNALTSVLRYAEVNKRLGCNCDICK